MSSAQLKQLQQLLGKVQTNLQAGVTAREAG
jgi:hypothetical protein